MKFKGIFSFLLFFVGTPLMLGQSSLPSIPDVPAVNTPDINSTSLPGRFIPSTTLPSVPSSLPIDSLRDAGINTAQAIPSDPARAARDLQSQYAQEGILSNDRVPSIPNTSNPGDLARQFAQRTFPEEFQAVQGKLGSVPTSLPSEIPSSLPNPSTIPGIPSSSLPGLPATPSIPSFPSSTTLPSLPSTPTLPPLPSISSIPSPSLPSI